MNAGLVAIGPSMNGLDISPPSHVWKNCLANLCCFADTVSIRLDVLRMGEDLSKVVAEEVKDICCAMGTDIHEIIMATNKWNRWNWREELIRSVDSLAPEIVLTPDCDEMFGPDLWKDLFRLRTSDEPMSLVFDYVMVVSDGKQVSKYPGKPHVKAYKWVPNITYFDRRRGYRGLAAPWFYVRKERQLSAQSKIYHFSHFDSMCREGRKLL